MESFISLFRANPAETFAYLFIVIFIVTIGLSMISFFNDYKSKKNTLNKMQAFNRSLKDLVEEFRSIELLFNEQKKAIDENRFHLNRIEQEISRLADSLNNEANITKAINLAKEGLDVDEISNRTGIPTEEVEPIVKYHGVSFNTKN